MKTSSDSKKWEKNNFLISTDKSLLQTVRLHRFLSEEAYWCLGVSRETVEKAIENSLCFGLYHRLADELIQIGYARVVTDYATHGWVCDVYVEKDFRGQGLAKWLMECVMSYPALQGLRRLCLATRDAQDLYSKLGFTIIKSPETSIWMEIKNNSIYL